MSWHILVIDDDEKLNQLLTDYLGQYDYQVSAAEHPQKGLQILNEKKPDMVILDIMLPDMDGFQVCREIRKTSDIPIIMLTARGEVMDRIVGLEIGADDYLPKPFEPRELLARIQTILRRSTQKSEQSVNILNFNRLSIDFDRQVASLQGTDIELTTAEFRILALFAHNPLKVLDRDQILDAIRGIEWDVYNRSIDVLISRLRQKLNDNAKEPQYIKTVWGSGYMFIGEKNG